MLQCAKKLRSRSTFEQQLQLLRRREATEGQSEETMQLMLAQLVAKGCAETGEVRKCGLQSPAVY